MNTEKMKMVLRLVGWWGASSFALLNLAGCGAAENPADNIANTKASVPPIVTGNAAGAPPASTRPAGVPADRPRFPGEPTKP